MMKQVGLIITLSFLASFSSARLCNDGIIRGVNFGGWLLLEPWITPSIFEEVNVGSNKGKIVDEYTYAQYVDRNYYNERLNRHWDEFIQLSDLEILVSVGISHIRVPYGYWMFDVASDEPFPPPPQSDDEGLRFYLKRMFKWADQLGMKILLDLHGGPGSQNGFDNSGRRGGMHFHEGNNPARAVNVLRQMSALVKGWIDEGSIKAETLYGLEFLNEPAGWNDDLWPVVRDRFNYDAYYAIRDVFPAETDVQTVFCGFRDDWHEFDNYLQPPGYFGVTMDVHMYQCFGKDWNGLAEKPEGWNTHCKKSCDNGYTIGSLAHKTFTGEFSLEVVDCQKYLDGGYAEPYKPPYASPEVCQFYNDNWASYPYNYKEFLKHNFLAQIDGYEYGENGIGWFFWTAKTENNSGPEWDFIFLIQNGIIPEDLCNRITYCNY